MMDYETRHNWSRWCTYSFALSSSDSIIENSIYRMSSSRCVESRLFWDVYKSVVVFCFKSRARPSSRFLRLGKQFIETRICDVKSDVLQFH